ncbi:MAG: class I SAM-dependent methyltransferase [Pseudomonadota bacterium]
MSANQDYLPQVRDQYEELPYPPRDPAHERHRLKFVPMDQLASINARCFRGARDLTAGMRVLVAGGGTGDSTVYLAEQLRDCSPHIVHLDLSATSIEVARQRLSIRGLDNVHFVQGSLLDVRPDELGHFDYINCSGVLHHLADPDAGLRALVGVLAPEGCMGLMVYAQYGRTAHYQIQALMRLVNAEARSRVEKLSNLRRSLGSLHPHHWLRFSEHVAPTNDGNGELGDSGLYDIYLHEKDRAYTIPQVYEWMASHDLHIPGPPGDPTTRHQYDPRTYVKDPALLATIEALPAATRYAIAELMYGQIGRHIFYATRKAQSAARLDDVHLCPTWLDDEGAGLGAKLIGESADQLVLSHAGLRFTTTNTPEKLALLRAIDGKRTTAALFAGQDLGAPALAPQMAMLEQLHSIDAITLRAPEVPVPPSSRSLQLRVAQRFAP